MIFYNNCRNSHADWLILIVSKGTDTQIYNLCDVDAVNENGEFEKNQPSICPIERLSFFL